LRGAAVAVVARTAGELGRIDMVVNNAGVMLLGPILDAPIDEWEQMIHVNVLGLLYYAGRRCHTSSLRPMVHPATLPTS
jgi:NADP-dependent 3-hydroxy acid dehydrogenase YdfG